MTMTTTTKQPFGCVNVCLGIFPFFSLNKSNRQSKYELEATQCIEKKNWEMGNKTNVTLQDMMF